MNLVGAQRRFPLSTGRSGSEHEPVSRYTGTGTHEGEYEGIEPTGTEVQLSGMRFCRLEDGKLVEVWGQRDDLGLLAQLGVVELPEAERHPPFDLFSPADPGQCISA